MNNYIRWILLLCIINVSKVGVADVLFFDTDNGGDPLPAGTVRVQIDTAAMSSTDTSDTYRIYYHGVYDWRGFKAVASSGSRSTSCMFPTNKTAQVAESLSASPRLIHFISDGLACSEFDVQDEDMAAPILKDKAINRFRLIAAPTPAPGRGGAANISNPLFAYDHSVKYTHYDPIDVDDNVQVVYTKGTSHAYIGNFARMTLKVNNSFYFTCFVPNPDGGNRFSKAKAWEPATNVQYELFGKYREALSVNGDATGYPKKVSFCENMAFDVDGNAVNPNK